MNNGRDCPHGRQVGKCDTCDLIRTELELEKVTAERDALATQAEALQSRVSVAERVEAIFNEAQELSFDDCVKLFPDEIRQVRADAVLKAANYLMGYLGVSEEIPSVSRIALNEYAASILAGKE